MIISPQNEVFNAIYIISERLGYKTFDYLPADKVDYPFVFIAEQFNQDRFTKTHLYGDLQQSIYIYHYLEKRTELVNMIERLSIECRKLNKTRNFNLKIKEINKQIGLDRSLEHPIWKGLIELNYRVQ